MPPQFLAKTIHWK